MLTIMYDSLPNARFCDHGSSLVSRPEAWSLRLFDHSAPCMLPNASCKASISPPALSTARCMYFPKSSGVSLEVFQDKIPVDGRVRQMCGQYGLNSMDFAMDGGEEYVLLFTDSSKNDIFSLKGSSWEVYGIGSVKEGTGVYLLASGGKKIVKAQAWSHL